MQKNLAKVYAAELEGIHAKLIEVEVDLHVGLHAFNIVGLADKALNEAKERVNAALKNIGTKPPNRENRKITVNLAPADVKKTGSQYDLAIAIGYLLATGQIKDFDALDKIFLGELALDGRLRPINGALNIAEMAVTRGFKYLILPRENVQEAAVVDGLSVIPTETLGDVIAFLEKRAPIEPARFRPHVHAKENDVDLGDILGQQHAKRALTIAAAGGHNVLMIGPPGVGKSLLAQALAGILPDLTLPEAIEVTKIYSAAGLNPDGGLRTTRPIRTPHQTASPAAVVGGGSDPKPGEISLAHRGILFLDELPEFPKNVLESLRGPLENGTVHVARAKSTLTFPAKFTLVAAMNPCPCGFHGDDERECRCSAYEVIRYQKKISGPLLDRIDLQVRVGRVKVAELRSRERGAPENEKVKSVIENARSAQRKRFRNHPRGIQTNAEMSSRETDECISLDREAETFVETFESAKLSPRGYYRLLKTARTIADLEGSGTVSANNLAEAFSYRLREEV